VVGCGTPIGFVQPATTDDTVEVESMFIGVVAAGYRVPMLIMVKKC